MLEAKQRPAEGEEGLMDLRPALIAAPQAAEPLPPGVGSLPHPAMPAQRLAQGGTTTRDIVRLGGADFGRPFAAGRGGGRIRGLASRSRFAHDVPRAPADS